MVVAIDLGGLKRKIASSHCTPTILVFDAPRFPSCEALFCCANLDDCALIQENFKTSPEHVLDCKQCVLRLEDDSQVP